MVSPRSNSTRLLSLLLPVALLSVFFACILTCCGTECDEALESTNHLSLEEFAIADDCEGCPFRSELSGGLPGRQSFTTRSNVNAATVFESLTQLSWNEFASERQLLVLPPTHDPPIKRIFALRI
jgi:hypothetical protein